jgi:hypothetical protein
MLIKIIELYIKEAWWKLITSIFRRAVACYRREIRAFHARASRFDFATMLRCFAQDDRRDGFCQVLDKTTY